MKYRINLFPPKEHNSIDKIIYFALHYLRYILVITQLVIILVFFYRLKVDQEIIDKEDILSQKQEIVKVADPLIKEVAHIDSKSKYIGGIEKDQTDFNNSLTYFLAIFPDDLTLDKLNMIDDTIEFSGITSNPTVLMHYYNRLKKENKFKQITFEKLDRDFNGYTFAFTLKQFVN